MLPAIYIRDGQRRLIGQLGGWERADVIPRDNAVATWTVTVSAGAPKASMLLPGNGLVFVRDGRTLESGPIRSYRRARGDQDGPGTLTVSGVGDTHVLADALAWPSPASPLTAAGNTQPDAYDRRSGPAETVIRGYVDANIGPSAQASRQAPGLVLDADQARGATVKGSARFDRLLELARTLAHAGGLSFQVVQQGLDLLLTFTTPRDLSASARFSFGLGNLRAYSYEAKAPTATDAIAAGGGQGAARIFVHKTRADPLWPNTRVERFVDQRQTTDVDELAQACDEALDEGTGQGSLSISPIDLPRLAYGRDYHTGDVVSVDVDTPTPIVDAVREAHLTWTSDQGETIDSVVGNPDASGSPEVYRTVSKLTRSVRDLQTRW